MPQLMPLSWVMSHFILVVVLLIITMIYSMSFYGFKNNILGTSKTNFMIWCW